MFLITRKKKKGGISRNPVNIQAEERIARSERAIREFSKIQKSIKSIIISFDSSDNENNQSKLTESTLRDVRLLDNLLEKFFEMQ